MKQNIIFHNHFVNGWGDTFLCMLDIINCIDFIKSKFNDYQIIYMINNHNKNHIPNGYVRDIKSLDDSIFAVTEILILSMCSSIYYSGEISNISLFNWYPVNVRKVKLITL